MLGLLAWFALLFAAIGGTAGLGSQPLAGKIAGGGQHLQRPSGSSHATRTARRDHPALAQAAQFAKAWHAAGTDDAAAPMPAGPFTSRPEEPRADEPAASGPEPRLRLRYRAHPSRAPPVSA